jgi:hypothetical protein
VDMIDHLGFGLTLVCIYGTIIELLKNLSLKMDVFIDLQLVKFRKYLVFYRFYRLWLF